MSWSRMIRRLKRRWHARRLVPHRTAVIEKSSPGTDQAPGRGWLNLVALYLVMSLAVGFAVAVLAVGQGRSRAANASNLRRALGYVAGQLVPTTVFLFETEDGLPRQSLETGLPMLKASSAPGETTGDTLPFARKALAAVTAFDFYNPQSLLESQMVLARGRELPKAVEPGLSTGPVPEAKLEEPSAPAGEAATTVPQEETGPLVRQQESLERLKTASWGTQPLIAVYHTHSSETYHGPTGHGTKSGYSEADYAWGQTTGVIGVGDEFVRVLTDEYRIPTVHSRNIHDYPVFRNAYTNSAATAKSILARYPSVELIIDLHRDGIAGPSDDNITAVMAGERLARIAFIVGEGQPEFPNPHWEKNQALAQDLHKRLEEMYPGLSRGVVVRKWPYNQELSTGALLVEVGDHNNTRAEAMRSATLLADVAADVLKERLNASGRSSRRDKGSTD